MYCLLPTWGHLGLAGMFVISICVILSMYGGGFATVPAYLADVFGTQMVGAIHGRLLTAWSAAGIVGPLLIAAIRQAQLDAGVAKTLVYDRTLYIMAVLLLRRPDLQRAGQAGQGIELHDRRGAGARAFAAA